MNRNSYEDLQHDKQFGAHFLVLLEELSQSHHQSMRIYARINKIKNQWWKAIHRSSIKQLSRHNVSVSEALFQWWLSHCSFHGDDNATKKKRKHRRIPSYVTSLPSSYDTSFCASLRYALSLDGNRIERISCSAQWASESIPNEISSKCQDSGCRGRWSLKQRACHGTREYGLLHLLTWNLFPAEQSLRHQLGGEHERWRHVQGVAWHDAERSR